MQTIPYAKFRIQYASNLLLHTKTPDAVRTALKPVAPHLALLGNIGHPFCANTKAFLEWAEENYESITWVPGELEYSSPAGSRYTTHEMADQYYNMLIHWNLHKTTFAQKYVVPVPYSPITLICSPIGIPIHSKYAHYKHNTLIGGIQKMSPDSYMKALFHELRWFRNTVQKVPPPAIVLSSHLIPPYLFPTDGIYCHLYGASMTDEPQTHTGGYIPWTGINMDGHKGFRQDAYLEYTYPVKGFLL